MAQDKLKVKTKLPSSAKTKCGKQKKGSAIQRRGNAPIKPKNAKFKEVNKLKKIITKTVNNAIEDELREKALEGKKSLTRNNKKTAQKS